MKNKILENLLYYWSNTCNYEFKNEERTLIPGFKLNNVFEQIYEVDKSDSQNILKIISQVKHNKVNKKSVEKWNQGWGQNYNDILKNKQIEPFIVPYYFGKYPLSRIMGKFIANKNYQLPNELEEIVIPKWDIPVESRWDSIEHSLVRLMMHNLVYLPFLKKILENNIEEIIFYELGAGTNHNLYFLKKFIDYHLPQNKAKYIALDWSNSTKKIIKYMGPSFSYEYIDYYKHETFPEIKENAFIFSLASLEQINISSETILSFIAKSNPKLVINVEPILQTLSKNSPLDAQSIEYMESRNYLPDFISSILKIKMNKFHSLNFDLYRSGIGSQFIDGYSVVSWSIL
tara:strand:- start:242 stop:1276 length:1035 start_codon:yes stop_codon:yes gene_type:complete